MAKFVELLFVLVLIAPACGEPRKTAEEGPTNEGQGQLVETSTNFDGSEVKPFLDRLVPLIDSGFAEQQVNQAVEATKSLDVDAEWERTFVIVYRGDRSLLRLYVYMDDIDSPDIHFLSNPGLVAEIAREIETFIEETGR